MKKTIIGILALANLAAFAAPPGGGREAFIQRQAYEEVQRVSGQVDMLESNLSAIAERVSRLENGGGELRALKAEIDALKSEISRLRNEMKSQRKEIVSDLTSRIDQQQRERERQQQREREREREHQRNNPAPEPSGTYTVQPGDTLSLIAQAFGTTVGKLKEMNKLRSDMLRVGQKLSVPDRSRR